MIEKFKLTIIGVFLFLVSHSQSNLASTKIKNLNNKDIEFSNLVEGKDTLYVVAFWATWCIPCIAELDNISDEYGNWQKEVPFKLIAISIDDSRTAQRVKSFAKGKSWVFDVFSDVNGELKRALSVTDVPQTFIIQNNKIVYQHTGYLAGEEENLLKELKTLNKK